MEGGGAIQIQDKVAIQINLNQIFSEFGTPYPQLNSSLSPSKVTTQGNSTGLKIKYEFCRIQNDILPRCEIVNFNFSPWEHS